MLYSDNGNMSIHPKHSTKLMTMLLVAEAIDRGVFSVESTIKVSGHANSQEGSQIWLRVGEEISASELIMSITAGNANDACVALAEAVAGSEDAFVSLMNQKAKELGMADTYYADCTGMSEGSYTTACDTGIVASHLSRYTWLDEYFKTYITYVRNGQTQIVNTNRMIRSYDPCVGMKYYSSDETGHCLVSSARNNGITMVCVIFGEQDKDLLFKTAKEKLGIGLSAYVMYKPKATDIYCTPVNVSKSVEGSVQTEVGEINSFVVRKSMIDDIKVRIEYFDYVTAPISKGEKVGRIVYSIDGEEIYSGSLVASHSAQKITFISALKKILSEIIKM